MPNTVHRRILRSKLLSKAYSLCSILELERGAPKNALANAKQSVRLLRRAWTNTEKLYSQYTTRGTSPRMEPEKLAEDVSQLNLSTNTDLATSTSGQSMCGSLFWALITPLLHGLIHLSNMYAHHGMFQETMYYAEQAHMLVKDIDSEAHKAMTSAFMGRKWVEAGVLDKGSDLLMKAKGLCGFENESRDTATIAYHLGNMHSLLGDYDAEIAAYEEAEAILKRLTEKDYIDQLDNLTSPDETLGEKMSQLSLSKRKVPIKQKAVIRPKIATKRKMALRAKSPLEASSSVGEECPQIVSFKAVVIRHKARALSTMKNYIEAHNLLLETSVYSNTQMDFVEQGLEMARQLILQSLERMTADPVYSVLQESTISFPSVVGHSKTDKSTSDRLSIVKLSPPRILLSTRSSKEGGRSRSPAPDTFIDKLRLAQEQLTEVYSVALSVAPASLLYSISALLNSVAILLSATGQVKGKPLSHPGFASCSIGTSSFMSLRYRS